MEIRNYDDLIAASEAIYAIANTAIEITNKTIESQKSDAICKIEDWLLFTFAPVVKSNMFHNKKFFDNLTACSSGNCIVRKSNEYVEIEFYYYLGTIKYSYSYFVYEHNGDVVGEWAYRGEHRNMVLKNERMIRIIIGEWENIKSQIGRGIEYSFREFNKAQQLLVEKQKEFGDLLNEFEV